MQIISYLLSENFCGSRKARARLIHMLVDARVLDTSGSIELCKIRVDRRLLDQRRFQFRFPLHRLHRPLFRNKSGISGVYGGFQIYGMFFRGRRKSRVKDFLVWIYFRAEQLAQVAAAECGAPCRFRRICFRRVVCLKIMRINNNQLFLIKKV